MSYLVSEDGKSHINVYSKGKTEIGRFLTNLAHTPFDHPEWGHFESVEGFWYYYFSSNRPEQLRDLYGVEAKQVGRKLSGRKDNNDGFSITDQDKAIIREVIRFKIRQYPAMWRAIAESSSLPFVHYYVIPSQYVISVQDSIVDMTSRYQWVLDELTDIRNKLVMYYAKKEACDK
jgi:hypothetical protein